MRDGTVERVRGFNRVVSERIGALGESYLGRGRPLGETRLLWEIGADGADVRDLRRRLFIDAGYASRLLRSLEAEGMVRVEAGTTDRRIRRASLTPRGLAERAELDRLSDGLVARCSSISTTASAIAWSPRCSMSSG
jgi:DNA-binding MarR family transcriptional regulator